MMQAMPKKCLRVRISPNTRTPIAAVTAVPTPDHIAYATLRCQCFSAGRENDRRQLSKKIKEGQSRLVTEHVLQNLHSRGIMAYRM